MIYGKKISQFQCDIDADGGMYDILDEIAALLEMIHRNCQEQDPDMANKFRTYVQEMTRDGSMVWSSDGSVPADTTAVHYERLCQAADYFGLEAQKSKTEEEMAELVELLPDNPDLVELMRLQRIEELADVYNMLDQLCILWNCEDEVQDMAEQKMIRTMQRIQSGYYDKGGSREHS